MWLPGGFESSCVVAFGGKRRVRKKDTCVSCRIFLFLAFFAPPLMVFSLLGPHSRLGDILLEFRVRFLVLHNSAVVKGLTIQQYRRYYTGDNGNAMIP